MERLTTDAPQTNFQTLMNYAYAKDGEVHLAYGEGVEDIGLCEYITMMCGCPSVKSLQDVMDGSCTECDCQFAILNAVATQAAETRARLKMFEDILGPTYDLSRLKELVEADRGFHPGDRVYVVEMDDCGDPCEVSGYMLLAVSGDSAIVTAYINDLETIQEHLDYHIEETADNYCTDLCVFPLCNCYKTCAAAEKALEEMND